MSGERAVANDNLYNYNQTQNTSSSAQKFKNLTNEFNKNLKELKPNSISSA